MGASVDVIRKDGRFFNLIEDMVLVPFKDSCGLSLDNWDFRICCCMGPIHDFLSVFEGPFRSSRLHHFTLVT